MDFGSKEKLDGVCYDDGGPKPFASGTWLSGIFRSWYEAFTGYP
jgi:hypothetical protein